MPKCPECGRRLYKTLHAWFDCRNPQCEVLTVQFVLTYNGQRRCNSDKVKKIVRRAA